jgi:hypothetical protein
VHAVRAGRKVGQHILARVQRREHGSVEQARDIRREKSL